jgi:hypothetical protein
MSGNRGVRHYFFAGESGFSELVLLAPEAVVPPLASEGRPVESVPTLESVPLAGGVA